MASVSMSRKRPWTSRARRIPRRAGKRPTTRPGGRRWWRTWAPSSPAVVVLEATGGYETGAASALSTAGLPVAIVNPRQVRDFAKALGLLEKTDAIDAAVLATFAARIRPTPRPLPDDLQADLHALVTRRRQLVEMLTAERNRVPLARGAVRKNLLAHIAWLEKQLGQDGSRAAHAD